MFAMSFAYMYVFQHRAQAAIEQAEKMGRRIHPLTVWPYRAGPKAGKAGPEDTLKSGRSGVHDQNYRLLGGRSGSV